MSFGKQRTFASSFNPTISSVKNILLLCLLLCGLCAGAQTNLYVDSSVAVSGAGTSWPTAYKTLTEALNVANAASLTVKYNIHIARGSYRPTAGTNRDSAFLLLRSGVAFYGGYPSGGGTRNSATNPTILSGDIGIAGDQTDNSYHIVLAVNIVSPDTIAFDGLSFIAGSANGTGSITLNARSINRFSGAALCNIYLSCPYRISNCSFSNNNAGNTSFSCGAAIYNLNTTDITYTSCSFSGNTAIGKGGGVFIQGGTHSFSNCTFSGNAAAGGGGGIYTTVANAYVNACNYTNNTASSGNGGALFLDAGGSSNTSSVTACTFSGNSAATGGAMALVDLAGPITGCTFTNNSAATNGVGGGLYISSAYQNTLTNLTFTGNTATSGGGVSAYSSANGIMRNCTFTNNQATSSGGGVSSTGFNIDSSSFSYNRASAKGGGLYAGTSLHTISATTFTADTAADGGGAYSMGRANFRNCVFLSNRANNGGGLYQTGTISAGNAIQVSNSVFSGNVATISGGGMVSYSNGANLSIVNSLFSGNKAFYGGGGIYDSSSNASIVNCTFAGDTALRGNGIYNVTNSSPYIANCIIWEGAANGIFNFSNSTPGITYSTVEGGYTGTGNLSTNPLFLNPASVFQAPTTQGDYHVRPCSPTVNAGTNSSIFGSKDLDGNTRVVFTTIDQGAYERQVPFPEPISGNSSVCVGSSIQLTYPSPGSSGGWASATLNTSISNITLSSVTVTGVTPGVDTITYMSPNGVCPFNARTVITVYAQPTATISGIDSACINSSRQLAGTPSGGTWSSSTPALATVSSTGSVTALSAGIDTIRYTYTNVNGCSATAQFLFRVLAPPVLNTPITGDTVLCVGDTAFLANATPGGSWSVTSSGIVSINGTSGRIIGTLQGTTTVLYTVSGSGCVTSVRRNVQVDPLPLVFISNGPTLACSNHPVQYTNSIPGGTWSTSDTSVATVDANGLVTPKASGNVTILYTVTNANGCSASARNPLTVFFVNAAITQNGAVLTANPAVGTYKWLDCDNNTLIAGQTTRTFTATTNGHYAVIVTQGSCTDTSTCVTVTGLGITPVNGLGNELHFYPNPTRDQLTITADKTIPASIVLRDITGKRLRSIKPEAFTTVLDLSGYVPGVYLVEVSNGKEVYVGRVSVVR